jgi:hypothetical protein
VRLLAGPGLLAGDSVRFRLRLVGGGVKAAAVDFDFSLRGLVVGADVRANAGAKGKFVFVKSNVADRLEGGTVHVPDAVLVSGAVAQQDTTFDPWRKLLAVADFVLHG